MIRRVEGKLMSNPGRIADHGFRIKVSKLMKQSLVLLAVFVLFQTEVKPHGIPVTPIERGAFTTADGCKSSALAWARTLQLGEGKDVLELNDGYLVRTDRRAVELRCRRQK